MLVELFTLLCLLIDGHAVADYPLQNEFMALHKNRHLPHPHVKEPHLWVHLLTNHAIIHGGVVGLITGHVWLGLIECILHWYIDHAKNEKITTLDQDQALHWLCKLFYVVLIGAGLFAMPWWLR